MHQSQKLPTPPPRCSMMLPPLHCRREASYKYHSTCFHYDDARTLVKWEGKNKSKTVATSSSSDVQCGEDDPGIISTAITEAVYFTNEQITQYSLALLEQVAYDLQEVHDLGNEDEDSFLYRIKRYNAYIKKKSVKIMYMVLDEETVNAD